MLPFFKCDVEIVTSTSEEVLKKNSRTSENQLPGYCVDD
jgi:hypothetical protein